MDKEKSKKKLSGSVMTLIGLGLFIFSFGLEYMGELGELFGGGLKMLGFVLFIGGLVSWNRQKNKKEENQK